MMMMMMMMMMGVMPPRLDDRGGLSSLVPPRRGDADSETRKQHGYYHAVPPPPRREMLKTGASWLRWRSFMVLPKYLCSSTNTLACGRRRRQTFLCSIGRTEKKGCVRDRWHGFRNCCVIFFLNFFCSLSLEGLDSMYCGVLLK